MARMSSSNFNCTAVLSRFWVFWIRNTIRKVTIVVLVLMTSCQVSLNPNNGPVTAQPTMTIAARRNASGWPMARAVLVAKRPKNERWDIGLLSSRGVVPSFPHREMPALRKILRLRLDDELADHLGGRAVERLH